MSPAQDSNFYYCPMHADVRRPEAAKCPRCGMDLVPAGARFALLRHVAASRWMLLAMAAAMLAVMLAIMALVD